MYQWSEFELAIQDALRQFVDAEIRPKREELEFGDLPPYDILRKLWRTFGIDVMAAEAIGKVLAREDNGKTAGGMGGALGAQAGMGVILIKELCRVSPGFVGAFGVSLGLTASTIMARGTQTQKERWLPQLATLETIGAWALTEPDSGSDAFGSMKTTVRRDGDDYVLNGQKTFITNGPYADVVVVYAKLDDGVTPARERKILTFVLERGMPGFTQGAPFRKMGFHSSPTGELFFADVR
ncbi:MAG: acyl-CoA dehydrogenase family protein, partial [Actinobacteria bacterium]|nr:acyl-CoA dehydrogenase family protein [Actinomycetota bacterium]